MSRLNPETGEREYRFLPSRVEKDGKLVGVTHRRRLRKVGRNEPCPCGRAAKFKTLLREDRVRTYDKKVNRRLRSMGRSATPSVGMLAGLDRRARHDSEQLA